MVKQRAISPFHLAIPVWNLEECTVFYKDILGCKLGRSSSHWTDFDLFGHQLVLPQLTDQDIDNIIKEIGDQE